MIEILDVLKCSREDLQKVLADKKCSGLIQRKSELLAKSPILQYGIPTYIIKQSSLNKDENYDMQNFINSLGWKWCEIKYDDKYKQVPIYELQECLSSLILNKSILIRKFLETDCCGYAWLNTNGNILIEVQRGGLYSFWKKNNMPSRYILDTNAKAIYCSEEMCHGFYKFNYDKRRWIYEESKEEENISLQSTDKECIIRMLLELNQIFKNTKLIWIKSEEKIFMFDIWIKYAQGVLE